MRHYVELTNEQRALRSKLASIGAHESWAKTPDRAARTAPARKAAMDRFEREVDPDGVMSPEDRAKAAENARTAYFKRLALKRWAS
jgi:hypothetical protein